MMRVKRQGELILDNLKELRIKNDYVYLSNEGPTQKETHPEEGEDSITCTPTEDKIATYKPTLESELDWNHCTLVIEEPIQLEERNTRCTSTGSQRKI